MSASREATVIARLALVFLVLLFSIPAFGFERYPKEEFGSYPYPEAMDPLPRELQPGNVFEGWPNYRREINWVSIPKWMAGTWASRDYRILKKYDHTNGSLYTLAQGSYAPYKLVFGDLQDASGTIWTGLITPDIVQMPLQGSVDAQDTIGMRALEVTQEGVAMWRRVLHVVYTSGTGEIQDSFTEERVTEYTPSGSRIILARITNRFYDSQGRATHTTNGVRTFNKAGEFRPVFQRGGVDMLLTLSEHLQDAGRPDLIPNYQ